MRPRVIAGTRLHRESAIDKVIDWPTLDFLMFLVVLAVTAPWSSWDHWSDE
jgi:hypothetical protein